MIIAVLICGTIVFAQTPKTNWADSLRYKYMLETGILAGKSALNGTDPVKASTIADSIKNHLYTIPSIEKGKKYIASIYYEATDAGIMAFDDPSYLYPMLIDYKQGKAVMLRNFASKFVYNSNNISTPRKRAEYAVNNMFLPLIYEIMNMDLKIDVPYIGYTFAYSYKDFSEKYSFSRGGSITVIVPVSEFKKLQLFQTTEDDFVKQCDFYMIESGNAVKFQFSIK